jgi:ribosomal protein S18 acetylase RimI-like enzyme
MTTSPEIAVSSMRADERDQAAKLLGRAYRDNPLTFMLLGDDPEVRTHADEVVFGLRIASMDPPPLVVRDGDRLVGVCGFDPPGGSRMTPEDGRRAMQAYAVVRDAPAKLMQVLAEWDKLTPKEPHWTLGPVAVDVARHGQGVGSAMVRAFCSMMDAERAAAFLETDTKKNVGLYEKFGFETIAEETIMGVPMWFMWRPAS